MADDDRGQAESRPPRVSDSHPDSRVSAFPLFHAGIEDYRLQDLSGGRCALTYTVRLEPTAVVRLAGPVTRPLFARVLRTGAQGLQSHVAASPRR
jgi:hypothetical protein